ncbi:MAG: hypothetical protein FWC58_07065 [Desulfobulbus sp.]|nr:hypothetical protein [Desulfobulbus sp.]
MNFPWTIKAIARSAESAHDLEQDQARQPYGAMLAGNRPVACKNSWGKEN